MDSSLWTLDCRMHIVDRKALSIQQMKQKQVLDYETHRFALVSMIVDRAETVEVERIASNGWHLR